MLFRSLAAISNAANGAYASGMHYAMPSVQDVKLILPREDVDLAATRELRISTLYSGTSGLELIKSFSSFY